MKKTCLLITIIILLVFSILIFIFSNKTLIMNKRIFSAAEGSKYIKLSDITPFEWDKAYIIEDSYSGGENLDKIVGVECGLQRLNVDWKKSIVFIRDNQFVFDYIYSSTKIMFLDLGKSIGKTECNFVITRNENEVITLKLVD